MQKFRQDIAQPDTKGLAAIGPGELTVVDDP